MDELDALYDAAIAGDANAIAELRMKADILKEDEKTILHIESQNGNTERVQFILREFANKNLLAKLTIYKDTALHKAIYHGHTEVAKVLIDAATHLPCSSFQDFLRQGDKDMDTALHAAVMYGNVDIVKLLVEADPTDTHIRNNKGKTPIYIAAEEGYTDILKVICTTCTGQVNMDGPGGITALQAAIKNFYHDIEVVEVLIGAAARLLSSGSDNDITDDDSVTSFQAFLRKGDQDLNTALHIAVWQGNFATAKLLVEADPTDRHNRNNEGITPFYIAVEGEFHDIVKMICTTCIGPFYLDGLGCSTALHTVIKHLDHDIEVVKLIIGAARDLSTTTASSSSSFSSSDDDDDPVSPFQAFLRKGDEDLNTALHIAVWQGNLATAKLLAEADPDDKHFPNNKGETPLYMAVERGYMDIVKMICTTCKTPSLFGPGDGTALHAAFKNLDEGKNEVRDVIKMIIDVVKCAILSKYEDLDEYTIHRALADGIFSETDEYRQTIIELAVERNYVEVVELILGVHNPEYEDRWIDDDFIGLMPLIYKATEKKYTNIIKVLTKRYQAGAELSHYLGLQAILISAIRSRNTEHVLRLLDDHDESLVLFADNLGWTALHHAAYHELDSVIPAILEEQKKFGYQFVYENMVTTPFYVAAEKGYTSTVQLLMQSWPSSSSAYTAFDKNGQNILHLSALQSKKEMIQVILKYCSQKYKREFVNKQDNNGDTPLHLLTRVGCFVPELIQYQGLDMKIENQEKWTPPDMLYLEDQIIKDQVQIKMALEDMHIDQKKDMFSSSVLPSKRETKDMIFNKQAKLMINEKHARMKEDTRAVANCFADAIAGDPISKVALEIEADTLQEEGKTILHVESKRGVPERVGYIVRELANKNLLVKLDTSKQSALHLAAHHGHTQVVEVLIDAARLDLPSSSDNDYTHNSVSSFEDFIRQANGQMGNTALHLAVLKGNVEIVKLLIEADPNDSHVQNNEGKSPIYIAVENGYKDIVKEICATCTALSLDGPGGRTTALHALIQNISLATEENRDAIRMIIDAAKHSNSAEDAPHLSFEGLFKRNDESGRTVLELAVGKSYVHAVELILRQDPAYQNGRGSKNRLMRLIYKAIDKEHGIDIVKLLSDAYETGIDTVYEGVLALVLAIKGRDKALVLQLLRSNEKLVTFADDEGWTPLHYAAYHQFVSIFEVIIKSLNNEFVYSHSTPFHVAAENGHSYTMKQLMKLWPNSSSAYIATNKTGQNILHLAAARNEKKMIQDILAYCPQVHKKQLLEQKDQDGNTALHLLISNGCYIPELINHRGLDLIAKNNKFLTPRDMLYSEDQIIADQVQIKFALDQAQTSEPWMFWKAWKFWPKGTEKETDIFESIVLPDRREKKDVLFNEGKVELMEKKYARTKKKLERYKDRTNTQIVVAALITTVTFTVGFTMPGGLHQSGEVDEGLVLLSKKRAFGAFMVTDALALLLSTSSLFFYFLQSIYEDPHQVARLNAASTGLNIVSVTAMMVTFITGTYVVLYNSPALAITVCIIGSLFFILVIVLLIKIVYDRGFKRNED